MVLEAVSKEAITILLSGFSLVVIVRGLADRFISKWRVPVWKRPRMFFFNAILMALGIIAMSFSYTAMHWYLENFSLVGYFLSLPCFIVAIISVTLVAISTGMMGMAIVFSPFDFKWT